MHPLLRYLLVATPLAVLMFLGLAGFFAGWDGHVVSRRSAPSGDHAVDTVLIVTADGDDTEVDWPSSVVTPLALPVDNTGVGPNKLPPDAVATNKSRFSLHFTVTTKDGAIVASPPLWESASAAALAWIAGLFLHNLLRSGSPFAWDRREVELPAPMPANLQETRGPSAPPPSRASRSQKGPPPRKPRRGPGR